MQERSSERYKSSEEYTHVNGIERDAIRDEYMMAHLYEQLHSIAIQAGMPFDQFYELIQSTYTKAQAVWSYHAEDPQARTILAGIELPTPRPTKYVTPIRVGNSEIRTIQDPNARTDSIIKNIRATES